MAGRSTRGRPVPPVDTTTDGTPGQQTPGETSIQGGQANLVVPGDAGVNLPPLPEFGNFFQSFPRLVETMHLQAQTMANMHAREGNAGAANQQRVAEPERANGATMMEHFRRMGPPTFKGESSP